MSLGFRTRCFATLWAVVAIAFAVTTAHAKDDFLPPEKAYRYSTKIDGDRLIVTWKIENGYYLYKKKLGIASSMSSVQLGTPAWPKGEAHKDEYFGEQEIYRGTVDIPVPIIVQGTRPDKLAIELKLQGCADAGLCYPPLTWKTEANLAAMSATSSLRALFKSAPAKSEQEFLPPDAAFKFGAAMERPDSVALTWIIADGYYLYKDKIEVVSDTTNVQIGQPQLPKGDPKHDEYFGDTEVYHQFAEASVPVARAAGSSGKLNLKVTYQGCAEGGLCYNPITKEISLDLPPTDVASSLPAQTAKPAQSTSSPVAAPGEKIAEQDSLAALVRNGNILAVLGVFFAIGIGLSFTPCVLPMIPILSGIIVGQGDKLTPVRGFSLAFTYVQGMALTYAAAGAISAALFQLAPQATFQKPWILITFAVLFIVLAFAMFGAFTLQLPSALQTRLTDVSNRQKGGTYIGTFVMGALSALIVTACVAPAIAGAMSVLAQAGSVPRGAGALYATGMGMGVPLLLVGASAGSLLPKVGPWMDTIKKLFGVIFLALALYVVNPLLPSTLSLLLWAALAIVSGFWIFSLKNPSGAPVPSPVRGVGLLILIYGILLLIGAASGGRDALQPLDPNRFASVDSGSKIAATATSSHGLEFERIKSVADLDARLAAAKSEGKPVMLDFYADWCVSCKEMEKYTFTDPQVQAQFTNAVLLQADVTANDALDQELMKRFGIFGPPTIAFFGADGVERKNYRLVGFSPAEKFRDHVAEAFGSS
jgi:thiol:disulfide interchange protein DsbD